MSIENLNLKIAHDELMQSQSRKRKLVRSHLLVPSEHSQAILDDFFEEVRVKAQYLYDKGVRSDTITSILKPNVEVHQQEVNEE